MFARAGFAALVLLSTACTAEGPAGTGSEPASEKLPVGKVQPDADPARSDDGPLRIDGSGTACIDSSLNRIRDFVYGDDLYETSAPIEIESLELVNGQDIRIVDSWVLPSRDVPLSGSWSGWPLPRRDIDGDRLAWDERVPTVGAEMDPGRRYNLLVRMRRAPGDGVQGFDAVRLRYRTSDASHVLRTRTTVRFRKDCR